MARVPERESSDVNLLSGWQKSGPTAPLSALPSAAADWGTERAFNQCGEEPRTRRRERTNVLVTRPGAWMCGALPVQRHVALRLDNQDLNVAVAPRSLCFYGQSHVVPTEDKHPTCIDHQSCLTSAPGVSMNLGVRWYTVLQCAHVHCFQSAISIFFLQSHCVIFTLWTWDKKSALPDL